MLSIVKLILSGDKALYEIILLSLKVSIAATTIGMLLGIPFGTLMGMYRFPGRQVVVIIIYTLMGLPPVLAGVIIYLLLSAKGPLGELQLLFTPTAMVTAQVLLVTPIITGLTMVAVRGKEKLYLETAVSMGASRLQAAWLVIREAKAGIMAAIVTAFGRAIAEVGAVMLVGGNIEHVTRVMTTSIILETRKGNFDLALSLGLVLLAISFMINGFLVAGVLKYLQRGEQY
ncbi:MAG: ABC transporter permease [Firmicutes bacterium]|nr:ABC transporter permease [Bacillota bacterium]